jgi:flagellar capping protein FliD
MGCSSSKVNVKISVQMRSHKSERVGVPSVDNFVKKYNDVIEDFADLTSGIDDKREDLAYLTGFPWNTPSGDGTLKKAVIGTFLQTFAAVNGALDNVTVKITAKPSIKVVLGSGYPEKAIDKQLDKIADYIEELGEIVTEKMPKLLESLEELASAVVTLTDNAASEFEALDTFDKVKAVAKTASLVASVPKVVAQIKNILTGMAGDIKDIKDVCTQLSDLKGIADGGAKCY